MSKQLTTRQEIAAYFADTEDQTIIVLDSGGYPWTNGWDPDLNQPTLTMPGPPTAALHEYGMHQQHARTEAAGGVVLQGFAPFTVIYDSREQQA